MLSPASLLFAIAFVVSAIYTPVLARRYPCDDMLVRKEWRNMSPTDKTAYVKAVKCLQSRPAVNPAYPQAKSRFDEFQAHYMKQADNFHNLGQYLPWHRHYIRTYEKALRNECGYQGATPYWDWSQDADSNSSISAAPVFDPVTGFGGNGVSGTYNLPSGNLEQNKIDESEYRGCVRDGPFKNLTLHVGPGRLTTEHCLTRGISDDAKQYLTSAAVTALSKAADFEEFRLTIEGASSDTNSMTNSGNEVVGGEMSNYYSGPGDPLFYLHHANIDRIWWNWQQLLPGTRFFQVSGPATRYEPIYPVGVDYPLDMGNLGLTVPIRDVLDLWSKPNCYTYA